MTSDMYTTRLEGSRPKKEKKSTRERGKTLQKKGKG